ncbi:carboxylesterase [Microbacterium mangrovi]|uniref:Carboxylic ester hydrolase n=1 Tax=Microbacterium mangrovi TaxID=1348253 RepID=A0A0B2A251_9MICO|nr:carboxylesterase family protein [Microbacterium mangrovi]KHK95662.1 carboxylesterase [Microbacterium mangrovi]
MTDTQTTTPTAYAEAVTTKGAVRGFWRGEPGTAGASAAFLGIPFAKAPVGALRFAEPQPMDRWDDVRDALDFGATAQRGDPGVTLIPEPSVPGESTLNVNVFTPAPGDEDAALPVLVWIHGGGYFAGSPASPWYDGKAFNRDGVVTVSIGYRLGFIGFGHVEGAPENRGVRDWIAGLEWVQANIRAFGGDPDRVTIAGQSAGGGAVLTLLGSEKAQHLFNGVWALSGATADVAPEKARTLTAKIANALGIEPTRAAFEAVSEDALLTAQKAATDLGADLSGFLDEGLGLGPAIDGDLIPRPTIESLAAGVGADKPLVLGATDDEFSMALAGQAKKLRWIPLSLLLGKMGLKGSRRRAYLAANRDVVARGHAAVLGRYISDRMFKTAVVRTADARGDAPTWVYRYSYAGSPFRSAVHCIDVPFWFDCLDSPVGIPALAGPNPPQALADATHGAAVVLIRERRAEWPAWSERPGTGRVFGGAASRPDVDSDAYAGVRPLL